MAHPAYDIKTIRLPSLGMLHDKPDLKTLTCMICQEYQAQVQVLQRAAA
jgi:hypothetical protein